MRDWQKNLQIGGRKLRLSSTFIGWSDKSIHTIETVMLDAVRNLETSIRNETMYNVAGRVVKEAKQILRDAKEESRALTADNTRSHHLEERLDFEWVEKDVIQISPPEDIPYAGITDLPEYTIAGDMRFYWFRYGFSRRAQTVNRPGNQYLTRAKKKYASRASIQKELDAQIRYAQAHGANVTSQGGNLGNRSSMARNRAQSRRQ